MIRQETILPAHLYGTKLIGATIGLQLARNLLRRPFVVCAAGLLLLRLVWCSVVLKEEEEEGEEGEMEEEEGELSAAMSLSDESEL